MNLNQDDRSPSPTSEVGLNDTQNEERQGNAEHQWHALLEQQNKNMMELIKSIKNPVNSVSSVVLPQFNPEKQETDAHAWCATANLCMLETPLTGSALMVALSRALTGSASIWLSQISLEGMTWYQFKDLFAARYDCSETSAATLIQLNASRPKENECYAAYAGRLMTSLMTRWQGQTVEQIAVATILAHISQFDTRLQRIAFTTEIANRNKLQQELGAYSHLKRKSVAHQDNSSGSKQQKFSSTFTIKCYHCGKLGHKSSECRSRQNQEKTSTPVTHGLQKNVIPSKKTLVCFKCGEEGHIATWCGNSDSRAANGPGNSSTVIQA